MRSTKKDMSFRGGTAAEESRNYSDILTVHAQPPKFLNEKGVPHFCEALLYYT